MAQISRNYSYTYGILKSFLLLFSLNGIIGQSLLMKPGKPKGLILEEATATSLKLSWESESTETLLQYKPKAEEEWWNIVHVGSTFTLQQLRPDTEYEIRVVAMNEYGQSQPSDVIEAQTGELVIGINHYIINHYILLQLLNGDECHLSKCTGSLKKKPPNLLVNYNESFH